MNIRENMGLSFDDVLLVPKEGQLDHRGDADLSTQLTQNIRLQIPIMSANMQAVTERRMAKAMLDIGGASAVHRFMKVEDQMLCCWDDTFAAVGVRDNNRIDKLLEAGIRNFLIDVAHGHHEAVADTIHHIRLQSLATEIIAGNVATANAALFLEQAGADAIKVGIGPGAACTTRTVTGFGVPQLTAISEISEAVSVPIIADGGIKNSGDIVKALAAGANVVMLGRLLAGCDESPEPGKYWGNASYRVNGHRAPEGIEGTVPLTGSLLDTLKPLLWGIRSGISYAGATTIHELQKNAEFIRVTPLGSLETATRLGA